MILCVALLRKNHSPSINLINWVRVELLRLLDAAKACNDQTAEIAARISVEHCNCFATISGLERDHDPYRSERLWEWKLDYQQRAFILFDFIRDKYRDPGKIEIDGWLEADEKRFDHGFLENSQLNALRTLSSQLMDLLATD